MKPGRAHLIGLTVLEVHRLLAVLLSAATAWQSRWLLTP
jgi:hypothetical protein